MVISTVWLREHFEGALRGQGLTPARRQKIREWEERVHETGAKVEDVAELEKILWRPIVLRDIAGKDIFNRGKYGRNRPIELICHNGHAWPKDLHFPQSREVHIYEDNVWHAIREVTQGEPLAVWLLGSQDRQLSVDQFVLQDGRTYRTREAHERLKAICAKLGNPELAERAFGEKHAVSIMAKEKERLEANPSQPPPRYREGLRGARSRRPLELDGLWHEGSHFYRHEGLPSGILPGYGWSQTLFRAVRASDSPHDPRGN